MYISYISHMYIHTVCSFLCLMIIVLNNHVLFWLWQNMNWGSRAWVLALPKEPVKGIIKLYRHDSRNSVSES